jgi:hypothetical protein
MNLRWLALVASCAGCHPGNQLWFAEDGSEALYQLVDSEPDPF